MLFLSYFYFTHSWITFIIINNNKDKQQQLEAQNQNGTENEIVSDIIHDEKCDALNGGDSKDYGIFEDESSLFYLSSLFLLFCSL